MWRNGVGPHEHRRLASLARRLRRSALFGACALRGMLRNGGGISIYLLVSHQKLERGWGIGRLKAATGARFVCLIHDLIPLDFPDLTRPRQARRHRRRLATVALLADAVIANSAATADALRHRLGCRPIPIAAAPLGVDLPVPAAANPEARPYFVCIGTIETRKNLGVLLEAWRDLACGLGDAAPRLMLIGRRGFGGERVARGLAPLGGLVTEHADVSDAEMAARLRGAQALLLPSLAEGFGLPVAEALALGVPVVCSDLSALRESGGGAPDYLDPLDVAAWHRAVLDYVAPTARREAQLARLATWRPPRWPAHFTIVERLLAELG
jgi:glycosyltransferase involved in cell wall biosynthesis